MPALRIVGGCLDCDEGLHIARERIEGRREDAPRREDARDDQLVTTGAA
ncbi:hypothetical protein BTZ20_2750 [Rhodococcus sp. MTM3W5.2]|nr:hypothetical protein BTZ20_2750 [Rhodococcus sp. MTM3W5.2]